MHWLIHCEVCECVTASMHRENPEDERHSLIYDLYCRKCGTQKVPTAVAKVVGAVVANA